MNIGTILLLYRINRLDAEFDLCIVLIGVYFNLGKSFVAK